MSLYSKEAKRKSEEKFAMEWIHENVSHYEGDNGNISIEEYFKLSPYEQGKGKYQAVFKKDLALNHPEKPDTSSGEKPTLKAEVARLKYIISESFDLAKCGYVYNYPSTPNNKYLAVLAMMREVISGSPCTIEELKNWLH